MITIASSSSSRRKALLISSSSELRCQMLSFVCQVPHLMHTVVQQTNTNKRTPRLVSSQRAVYSVGQDSIVQASIGIPSVCG